MQFSIRGIRGLLCIVLLTLVSVDAVAEAIMVVPGQYIIQRKSSGPSIGAASLGKAYDVSLRSRHFEVVTARSAAKRAKSASARREPLDWSMVKQECDEIKKDPSVKTCEPDIIRKLQAVPNDPAFSQQWALRDLVNGADVGAVAAWDIATGSAETLVGVIDSGVFRQHEDLSSNLWTNPNETVDGIDNDGNGYVDDVNGVNTDSNSGEFSDCNGHGTHVSGVIAARGNNGVGVAGVNWVASLIAVSTDGDCSGSASVSAVIKAYDYFYDLKQRLGHPVRVINASFGGDGEIEAEAEAIARLNAVDILLVAAAGNENRNLDQLPSYPASYDLPNVITVGATGPTRLRAAYSNFGQTVDIAAPGGDSDFTDGMIASTYSPEASGGGLYAGLEGTSMATPMVTGALALLASHKSYLSGEELKQILLNNATVVPALDGIVAGARFLNLAAMMGAGDPEDQCPSDPNKFSPGLCGCGVPESLSDADGDGTRDCVDGCSTDPFKTTSGVCGCSISDGDGNGNGQADCLDPVVSGLVPGKPKVSLTKTKLVVKMTAAEGVEYLLEVTTTKPRTGRRASKPSVKYYIGTSSSGAIKRPARGSSVRVRYAYRVPGSDTDLSEWSRPARVSVLR
jgi:thermitase